MICSGQIGCNFYKGSVEMKEYQNFIGKLLIAAAIIIASLVVANALENLGQVINSAAMSLGNLIR